MNEIKEFVSEEFIFDSIPKPSLGRITEPELETRNSKPGTRNPKLETRNTETSFTYLQ